MSFKDLISEVRRLFTLQLLSGACGSVNQTILNDARRRSFVPNRRCTRDVMRADIEWRRARHLVSFDGLDDTVLVAVLTARGGYVVSGDIEIEGVTPPDRNR